MNRRNLCNLIGAITLGFVSYATISANTPEIYSPFSFFIIIPLFFLDPLGEILPPLFNFIPTLFVCSIIPLLFLAWSHNLYIDNGKIPRRSIVFFSFMIILSCVYLIGSWNYGLEYQGKPHVVAIFGLNLLSYVTIISLFVFFRKKPSSELNYIFHLIGFAWLAWVAFPWLGELL